MHKTGTTSVKHYLKNHRKTLLKEGILYPTSIGDLGNNAEFKTNDPAGLKNVFASELAQIPDDGTVYIANENYFGLGNNEKQRMIEFLDYFGLEITLLCYLRPQVGQAVSHYQQYVLECFRRELSLNYANAVERFNAFLEKGYYKYSRKLDEWAKYVAKESMDIRVYHKDSLRGGCTVKDAASLAGFEVVEADVVKQRMSLSAEKLCFLKTMLACIENSNRSISGKSRMKILLALDADNTGLPLEISSEDKSYIAKACVKDNNRLVDIYLEPGSRDFFWCRTYTQRSENY